MSECLQLAIKLFFLLTPFFVLSVFLSMTGDSQPAQRRRIALKTTLSILLVGFCLLFFGQWIFDIFGITLDSFRIGAGAILFLSAISLIQGKEANTNGLSPDDIAVVPLAIPITVGPGVTGALLVIGGEVSNWRGMAVACGAFSIAAMATGILLYLSPQFEKLAKKRGLIILSKVTGLMVASLSAQMIFTGIRGFLG